MSIKVPADEWDWEDAYPEKTQLETIKTVMGFFDVHEEGLINQSYNSDPDENAAANKEMTATDGHGYNQSFQSEKGRSRAQARKE